MSEVFTCFSAPLLSMLTVSIMLEEVDNDVDWPMQTFSSFISRSACTLTSLCLINVWISSQTVPIQLFQMLSSLIILEVKDRYSDF